MACSCLKKDFNIYVYTEDCYTLVIEDHSIWMDDHGYNMPEKLDIEVQFPNGSVKDIKINPLSKNVFKAEELNIGTPFEDGVYCFRTESCETLYTTHRLISCNVENELRKIKSRLNINSPREDWEQIWKLEGYFEVAENAAKFQQFEEAQEAIDLLYDEIQNLNCCL